MYLNTMPFIFIVRHKEKQKSKLPEIVLQEVAEPVKGDGVIANVDNPDAVELLDYEDDLSIDDEGSVNGEGPVEHEEVVAGTSKMTNEENDLTAQLAKQSQEKLLSNPIIQQLMAKQFAEQNIVNNPVIQDMMESFFKNKFQDLSTMKEIQQPGTCAHLNMMNKDKQISEVTRQGKDPLIKSPSDITVYTPALQKKLTPQSGKQNPNPLYSDIIQMVSILNNVDMNVTVKQNNHDPISNFVESVRQNQHLADFNTNTMGRKSKEVVANELKEAQLRAERAILEAEKFQAQVEPPGNMTHESLEVGQLRSREEVPLFNIGSGVSDDDFFHLTCHIEPNLIHKIEKGEFAELEKLLPKDKLGKKW